MSEPLKEELSACPRTVRRMEITVEREICRMEVHRTGQVVQGTTCPTCGRALPSPDGETT